MKPAGPQRFGPLLDDWRSLASRFNASDAVFRRLEEHQRRPATPPALASCRMLYAALGCGGWHAVLMLIRHRTRSTYTATRDESFRAGMPAGSERRARHVDPPRHIESVAVVGDEPKMETTQRSNRTAVRTPRDDQNETKNLLRFSAVLPGEFAGW